jgi:hypothetical protein
MEIVDRTNDLPTDLSRVDKKPERWIYREVKPRGDFQVKDRERRTPSGWRPPWKSSQQRDAERSARQARRVVLV